ncbi:MAG: class I SAM-dependent methyltransferase [Dehalococcoidia bacterium]|nr:class I SAM-dependent methyltransferase [Dehalococcoidia bacterium]
MIQSDSSWQHVSQWYSGAVGERGHLYHRQVVMPKGLKLLALGKGSSLLDLACGQGVLGRYIPEDVYYVGVDSAPALIAQAKSLDPNKKHIYLVGDASRPMLIEKTDFTHASIVFSLQNIKDPEGAVRNCRKHLRPKGKLLIVANHPCFRVPRQSRWEIDQPNKLQFRRIDAYMSPMEVPIVTHPGKGEKSQVTWSYHLPLSEYSRILSDNGFVIEKMEEWLSEKRSIGVAAKMENRARAEFPLFLAILARKD